MWKYLPLLNAILQLLVTLVAGVDFGYFGLIEAAYFVPQGVRFVCTISIPALFIRGFGIEVDFYSNKNIWSFVASFMILCTIGLGCSVIATLCKNNWRGHTTEGPGEVVVLWNCLTLTSTLIMGIPLCTGLLGDKTKGRTYSTLAGIAVFLYQFPMQIVLMELQAIHRDDDSLDAENEREGNYDEERQVECNDADNSDKELALVVVSRYADRSREISIDDQENNDTAECNSTNGSEDTLTMIEQPCQGNVCTRATERIILNPVVLSELLALFLSISTIGPRFLSPKSGKFVEGLGWIYGVLEWLGECASPLSIFTMGVWMQERGLGKIIGDLGLIKVVCYMLLKLFVVPLAMVWIAKYMPMNNEARHVAVLIASFPIAMLSFPVGYQYSTGETVLAANFAAATVMLLPTILVWEFALDSIGIFPIPS